MSASRAERLGRLHKLQGRLRGIEEARLGALRMREGEIRREAEALLTSLADPSPLAGLFLEGRASRLRRREAERAAVQAEIEAAEKRLAVATAREKRVERIGREAQSAEDAADERTSLAEILDAHLMRRAVASLE